MTKLLPAAFLTAPCGSGVSLKRRLRLYSSKPMKDMIAEVCKELVATPCNLQPPATPCRLQRLSPFARGRIIVPLAKGDSREAAGGRWRLQISGGGNKLRRRHAWYIIPHHASSIRRGIRPRCWPRKLSDDCSPELAHAAETEITM